MKPLATAGSPKERVTEFFRRTPRYSQYTIQEIAAGVDLPVKKVTGVVSSLLKQDRLAGEERDDTKYFRWIDVS
ncbi:MAG: hypothetical protein R6U10_07160 [Thermoplasmatota archaeon]